MKVKLILERATTEMKLKGEACRKVVEVEIPDTDNSEAEKKGVWKITGYFEGEQRMTKEELKQEAEEWLSITDNHLNDERTHFLSESEYAERAYLAGAEPREKRIAELKAQIEKMKNCRNCKKFMIEGVCGHFLQVGWCKNWELED